jgi:hypothetical protein
MGMDDTVVMRMARKAELDRNFIANSTGGWAKEWRKHGSKGTKYWQRIASRLVAD